jgi:DNA-binding GntR family transcriptional regulator
MSASATITNSSSRKSADHIYLAIKHMIGEPGYAPGGYLREEQMARTLGVSRTPVREAFRRLGAEGWLEVIPNRGVRVKSWSIHDVEEIFDARALIEPYLSRQATTRISAAELVTLRELAVAMRDIVATTASAKVIDKWFVANEEFHQIISLASGNSRLNDTLNVMKEIPLVKRTFNSYDDEARQRSIQQHFELVEAMENRDSDWVEAVMKSHILRAKKSVIRKLTQQKKLT